MAKIKIERKYPESKPIEQQHKYTYENKGINLTEEVPIDLAVPENDLLSEDYIRHVIISDMLSLDGGEAGKGKIPLADPSTGRLRSSWLYDQMVTTSLPIATEAEAINPAINDYIMTPKATHFAVNNIVKDATTEEKGIVRLADSLTLSTLDRADLAVTPLALKNYLASSGGFNHAGYNSVYGITAYSSNTDLDGMLQNSNTKTNDTLKSMYSDTSITPYSLYTYIANNSLTLNKDSNIIFGTRSTNGATSAPSTVGEGRITVNRTTKTMTASIKTDTNKTSTATILDANGNTILPGNLTVSGTQGVITDIIKTSSNSAPKLGTSKIGGPNQPIYIGEGGVITTGTDLGNLDDSYLSTSGGTVTGMVTFSGAHTGYDKRAILITGNGQAFAAAIQDTGLTKGTAPSSAKTIEGVAFYGSNMTNSDYLVGDFYMNVDKNNVNNLILKAHNLTTPTTTTSSWLKLVAKANSDGVAENYAELSQSPGVTDNSNKIATTKYVNTYVSSNVSKTLTKDTTIYVAATAVGDKDGSSAINAMSLADMWKYLASVRFPVNTNYRVIIKFVPKADKSSYGNLTFDYNKMPGIKYLTIDTSTGTDSTTSNYTINSPLFGSITIYGPLTMTIRNIQASGAITAYSGAIVYLNTFISGVKFVADTYGTMVFQAGTYNINDARTNYLFMAQYYGRINLNTSVAIFNFNGLCQYTAGIFYASIFGSMFINYGCLKFTGTKPNVTLTVSLPSGGFDGKCSTSGSKAAKEVTVSSSNNTKFTLANNTVIYITFAEDNTAAKPTLNVNSTGSKPIYFNGTNIPANYINKTIRYKLTYNGTAWVCGNTFQRSEVITNDSFLSYSNNYNTTYNSGSWNWDGFSRYWVSGTNINNTIINYLPLSGGTVTGTLTLSRTTDAEGTKNNKPALIVGGTDTSAHLELDNNEIMAKSDGTTPSSLWINSNGGNVAIGGSYTLADGSTSYSGITFGGLVTSDITFSKTTPKIMYKHTGIERNVAPSANVWTQPLQMQDKKGQVFGGVEHGYSKEKVNRMNLICYNGTTTDTSANAQISVGYDKNGKSFTYAPTPANYDNSDNIATTKFIRNNTKNNTSKGAVGWESATGNGLLLVNVNTLAYWNGAYSGTNSNLAYCNQGAFGSIVTKSTSDYAAAKHTHDYANSVHNHDTTYLKLENSNAAATIVTQNSSGKAQKITKIIQVIE